MENSSQEINVNIEKGIKELIIRHGQAPKPVQLEPVSLTIEGVITAPSAYWAKRNHLINHDKTYVEYSRSKKVIALNTAQNENYGTTVVGRIAINPLIEKIGINDLDVSYDTVSLLKTLKLLRPLFVDKDQHTKLIAALRNTKAKLSTIIDNYDDQKGNKRDYIDRQLEMDIDLNFALLTEILVGAQKLSFDVKIVVGYNAGDQTLNFGLESIELLELINEEVDQAIERELKLFGDILIIQTP